MIANGLGGKLPGPFALRGQLLKIVNACCLPFILGEISLHHPIELSLAEKLPEHVEYKRAFVDDDGSIGRCLIVKLLRSITD